MRERRHEAVVGQALDQQQQDAGRAAAEEPGQRRAAGLARRAPQQSPGMGEEQRGQHAADDADVEQRAQVGAVRMAHRQDRARLRRLRPQDGCVAGAQDRVIEYLRQQRQPDGVDAARAEQVEVAAADAVQRPLRQGIGRQGHDQRQRDQHPDRPVASAHGRQRIQDDHPQPEKGAAREGHQDARHQHQAGQRQRDARRGAPGRPEGAERQGQRHVQQQAELVRMQAQRRQRAARLLLRQVGAGAGAMQREQADQHRQQHRRRQHRQQQPARVAHVRRQQAHERAAGDDQHGHEQAHLQVAQRGRLDHHLEHPEIFRDGACRPGAVEGREHDHGDIGQEGRPPAGIADAPGIERMAASDRHQGEQHHQGDDALAGLAGHAFGQEPGRHIGQQEGHRHGQDTKIAHAEQGHDAGAEDGGGAHAAEELASHADRQRRTQAGQVHERRPGGPSRAERTRGGRRGRRRQRRRQRWHDRIVHRLLVGSSPQGAKQWVLISTTVTSPSDEIWWLPSERCR